MERKRMQGVEVSHQKDLQEAHRELFMAPEAFDFGLEVKVVT
jgi:hypothetical protein